MCTASGLGTLAARGRLRPAGWGQCAVVRSRLVCRRWPSVVHEYLAEARRMLAGSDMYEVLSHIDYAMRYWPAQQEGPFNPRIFEDVFRQVIRDLAGSGGRWS